jgi:hypothetical protein
VLSDFYISIKSQITGLCQEEYKRNFLIENIFIVSLKEFSNFKYEMKQTLDKEEYEVKT